MQNENKLNQWCGETITWMFVKHTDKYLKYFEKYTKLIFLYKKEDQVIRQQGPNFM